MPVLFFLFWIVLNGRITVEITVFGLVISFALYLFLWRFLDYTPRYDLIMLKKVPWMVWYVLLLIREVFAATLVMAGFIFNHRDIPEPVLVSFHLPLKSAFAQMVLANSITLTPGTITVDMHEGYYRVHCYDKSMAEGLEDSVFVRCLLRLEESL